MVQYEVCILNYRTGYSCCYDTQYMMTYTTQLCVLPGIA